MLLGCSTFHKLKKVSVSAGYSVEHHVPQCSTCSTYKEVANETVKTI